MAEKRLIDWETLWNMVNICGECQHARQCDGNQDISEKLCPVWSTMNRDLTNRLRHERDIFMRHQAERIERLHKTIDSLSRCEKLARSSLVEEITLQNANLIKERDEITKRRSEVQESCEKWRAKCYKLEEQIEILKQRSS
jgi:hypothetical protein